MKKRKDKREKTWKRQRAERGFDDRDLWCLDATIAEFILPRLKAFRKQNVSNWFPDFDNSFLDRKDRKKQMKWGCKKTNCVIDKMILAFELLIEYGRKGKILSKEENKNVTEGLRLFYEYFRALWY